MKKNCIKILTAMAVMTTMLIGFTGCSSDPEPTNAPSEQAEATTTETTESEATTEGGDAEYAVVLKTLSSPFWQGIEAGINKEAEKLGVEVDVYAANSEDDIEGQVNIVENCINKGYKAIGVAPLSPVNLNSTIAQATEKGIYVINIDEKVDIENLKEQGGAIQGFVSTDNKVVGKMAADYIISQLPDGGQVAIIEGKSGNVSGEDRKAGATETFNANPKFEIVESLPADWDRTKAYDVASNMISKYPDLKAIYCCNDTMAMGALEAVKDSGKDIIVVGTDGNEDAIASVKNGELSATVAQNTELIGATSLQMMHETYTSQAEINPELEPESISAEPFLITKDSQE